VWVFLQPRALFRVPSSSFGRDIVLANETRSRHGVVPINSSLSPWTAATGSISCYTSNATTILKFAFTRERKLTFAGTAQSAHGIAAKSTRTARNLPVSQIGLGREANVSLAGRKRRLLESFGEFFSGSLVGKRWYDHAGLALSPVGWGGDAEVGCELEGINHAQNLEQKMRRRGHIGAEKTVQMSGRQSAENCNNTSAKLRPVLAG
jgi:hypothetical protein